MQWRKQGVLGRWEVRRRRSLAVWDRLSPAQAFVLSFAVLVMTGAAGLRWLPGLYTGDRLGWIDCIFTATSAVCVTGLIVVDTATYFTVAGQAFILLLIQLGGLGIITFTSLIIVGLGRRLSLRAEVLAGPADVAPMVNPSKLIGDVIRFTLAFEGAGALLLYVMWIPKMGVVDAAWPAMFHSISAFCNAGFSTFSDSLTGLNNAPVTLAVISALVIAGGIGFLTLEEMLLWWRAHRIRAIFRMSLHSRLVITTTALLLLVGWALFAVFEWDASLAGMSWLDRLSNALFMATTARTAGFNAVDYANVSESGNFLTILLMSIGGSPGSTAGGMKTTTFALLGLLAWSRMRGRVVTSIWSRSVPEETSQRAVGLFVVVFVTATVGILLLSVSEGRGPDLFMAHMFEAVSAFNTVGLSMGVTDELSGFGRWVTIVLMFLGRVGPLTFAVALTTRRRDLPGFRYATEDIVVG